MPEKPIQGEKRVFMTGNEVVAWAALAAEADIMYGYPITPQNEIMHYWTRMLPKYGRRFLQTEDELSAGFTTAGGVLAGRRAFTATAGPGNTLMQEPMSMAEAMRLPVVVIVQQRGGPSTATVIYSQQEVTMTTLGGNGEGLRVVYSTANHQELFDYTIKAFNTAWKYRFPTFVLGDGYQAKMRESLTMYDPASRGITMVPTEPYVGKEGTPGVDREPTHLRNTYNVEEELFEVLEQYLADYAKAAPEIAEYDAFDTDDADLVVISHGVVSRACKAAVKELREEGYKVGYFRPITLRPLPVDQLREVAGKAKQLLVVESANGQLDRLVKEAIYGNTTEMLSLFKPGVGVTTEEVVARVKEIKG
ncbi:transketolase C-terminal domain-containing protein [Desulfallas thermosapovorans]|uniref:2-oxoglutarate ferredoxin oxidoreductase subunit alpha n=1 Tax=Desulfallas thermosapovorans DSM 6562 TaxID=1121431 RepID=A0A5S4ZW63_9FIRM|nr:transketolase C-terminal domain-containing protein [Desulfallas thermosapovorans]TYO97015.1 2-oxoglutarate ferredoxin oxidoreductase subunit alpha [Desulfallas thermosapovorans DSM 6562]